MLSVWNRDGDDSVLRTRPLWVGNMMGVWISIGWWRICIHKWEQNTVRLFLLGTLGSLWEEVTSELILDKGRGIR